MSKINRYEIDDYANFDGVYYYAELKENKNGDYCKWSEVKELETQLAEKQADFQHIFEESKKKDAEIERLKEVIEDLPKITTAMKAECMGEFKETYEVYNSDDEDYEDAYINISWSNMKDIYAMMLKEKLTEAKP
tara:strand:+ start:3342 stop:3746 length:405 start_codon:yes stop_codon:yes gene_type:complete